MRGLITAVRTLTIIPVPGRDTDCLANSFIFFPVIGLALGLLVQFGGTVLGLLCAWPAGQAVLCVALSAFLTRGLHLDGLADTFDGISAHTMERRLEIMKDPHIGTFGVVALVCCLIAKFAAYSAIFSDGRAMLIPAAFVTSRAAQVLLAVILPYARAAGGTAEQFVKGAAARHLFIVVPFGAFLCMVSHPMLGPALYAGGLAVALILAGWMKRMFGGVTGDLLGMGNETIETLLLGSIVLVKS